MVKMIPPYISEDVKSQAERKIFNGIKESGDMEGFTCLHSLGLSRHIQKRQGEIDFVLVGNKHIVCLEVKGGRVSRKNGVWIFTDRFGREGKKVEGPFAQAASGMFSLKADIENQFGPDSGYIFCYGVVFPDIEFLEESPEWDRSIIYDLRDSSKPFGAYVNRLTSYWTGKILNGKQATPSVPKSKLINYLRGDFEIATRLWSDVLRVDDEITKFTKEQYRALDHMEGNPRVIFNGVAGTGKTLLAVEKMRRLFYGQKRSLLLCFNKLLGVRLRNEISLIDPENKFLQANSIHKYFFDIVEKAGLKSKLDKENDLGGQSKFYNETLPELFLESFKKLGLEKFDCIVVDEGQDLLSENYLVAIDSILAGGLNDGQWAIFLDSGAQSKLFNRFSLEAYKYIKSLGAPEYKLDLNVRNTLQVATQAAIVSGFPVGRTIIEGPKVEYKLCKDESDMALKVVDLIEQLVGGESVPPSSITVLTPRNAWSMSLFRSGIKLPPYLVQVDESNIVGAGNKILYASTPAFKGLENNIIIYIDLESFSGDYNESTNYVAMTRARTKLYVFMDKKLAGKYQERLNNFAKIE